MTTDKRARLPQLAKERVAVANLPPTAPHDAGGAPAVDYSAYVPPVAAVANIDTREVVASAARAKPAQN